jgi:hypothetical protein
MNKIDQSAFLGTWNPGGRGHFFDYRRGVLYITFKIGFWMVFHSQVSHQKFYTCILKNPRFLKCMSSTNFYRIKIRVYNFFTTKKLF